MQTIRLIFTRRAWNPVSFAIRVGVPRSLLAPAVASHCIIVDGDFAIEATMLHGVRRVPLAEALKGSIVVDQVDYSVPDAEAGLRWARGQVGGRYDYAGAFGMLTPDRNWQDPADWFCFEFGAMTIHQAGRRLFRNVSHISASTLLAVDPAPVC